MHMKHVFNAQDDTVWRKLSFQASPHRSDTHENQAVGLYVLCVGTAGTSDSLPCNSSGKKKIVLVFNYIINIFTFWGVSHVRSGFGQERKPATEAIVCRLLRAVAGSISM